MSSDSAVMMTVLTSAGMSETFSLLYSHAKRLGLMCGTPLQDIADQKDDGADGQNRGEPDQHAQQKEEGERFQARSAVFRDVRFLAFIARASFSAGRTEG